MVYMDFEALMKNRRTLPVYCVCTNCRGGARQERPPPDRLFQDVVIENKKIRSGEKPGMVMERSVVKAVYVHAKLDLIRAADSDWSVYMLLCLSSHVCERTFTPFAHDFQFSTE